MKYSINHVEPGSCGDATMEGGNSIVRLHRSQYEKTGDQEVVLGDQLRVGVCTYICDVESVVFLAKQNELQSPLPTIDS